MPEDTNVPIGRPRVVVSTIATVDGRITTRRSERLLDPAVSSRWRSAWPADVHDLLARRHAWIEHHHAPTVTLEGSGTFVGDDTSPSWADDHASGGCAREDYLPRRTPRWFVVVDSRGRVDWQFTGDDETALLVLVAQATPSAYLKRLRELGVGYLIVGQGRVDLELAVRRLGQTLGARCIVSEGGGGINGALLRVGLVDEIHVLTIPALVGGLGTPSLLDGPPLEEGGTPVRLRCLGVTVGDHGSTWAKYQIDR